MDNFGESPGYPLQNQTKTEQRDTIQDTASPAVIQGAILFSNSDPDGTNGQCRNRESRLRIILTA